MRHPNELTPSWQSPSRLGARISMICLIQALTVAEYLNFRHAANFLDVAQSSVSLRVKALEEEVGILLFERHSRGLRLTDAGRHFVESVAVGIAQLDHAVKTAGAAARGDLGRIRVGVHALTPGSFLDGLLGRYRKAHPHVAIEIIEGTARDIIAQLRADQLDIAFVAGAPDLSDRHSRRIWHEPLFAVLPADHALAGVLRMPGRWAAPSILRCDVERCTLLQMIAQGFGASIVGQAAALVDIPGVVFRPFRDEPEPVPFSAVWSPYNQSAALRNLLDLARKMDQSTNTPPVMSSSS